MRVIIALAALAVLASFAAIQTSASAAAREKGAGQGNCAVAFQGGCRSRAWHARRQKCAAIVQSDFAPGAGRGSGAGARNFAAREALKRCMQRRPM